MAIPCVPGEGLRPKILTTARTLCHWERVTWLVGAGLAERLGSLPPNQKPDQWGLRQAHGDRTAHIPGCCRRVRVLRSAHLRYHGDVVYVCHARLTHADRYVVTDVSYASYPLQRSENFVSSLASLAAQRLAKLPAS